MSQVKTSLAGLAMAFLLAAGMTGCSDVNNQSVFDTESGKHPENWVLTHPAAYFSDQSRCNGCHVSDHVGGTSMVSCGTASMGDVACHQPGKCTTCHTNPPSGTEAPNAAGAHVVYFNAAVYLHDGCDTCHYGAGIGTPKHANGTNDVNIMSKYSAKNAQAVHNADGTCSGVSCHGGQTTPEWFTGSIDSKTECDKCHTYGTAQYNSFNSGKHNTHVNVLKFTCTTCHDTSKLVIDHWTNLDTHELELAPSKTLMDSLHYEKGSCSPGCHEKRSWLP